MRNMDELISHIQGLEKQYNNEVENVTNNYWGYDDDAMYISDISSLYSKLDFCCEILEYI